MRIAKTYDDALLLKDAGLVAADDAGQVGGSDVILDIGSGMVEGDLVVDITAIEIASDTELYRIYLEGSNSATFASGIVPLACLEVGAKEVIDGDTDSAVGRYTVPFRNERAGTLYRYIRVYTDVTGDIETGINFTAFIATR